jgi:thiol:disulfide interchange protein DsbD
MILVPSSVSTLEKKSGSGLFGDFFKGMFATILATPCSGPFLGATLAWTLTQPALIVFTVFTSIGLGMASPYVLFSSSRRLAKLIPKPGSWMKDFKNLMGFLLLGMAIYLMIGLPQDMILSTIGLCLFLSFAIGVYSRFSPWGSNIVRKTVTGIIALFIIVSGVYLCFGILYNSFSHESASIAESKSDGWVPFSPELIKNAHARGQNIMIDFTANWCMNCQYNEVMVLYTEDVNRLAKEKNILTIKADFTRKDPQIKSLLENLGSRSVPFLAVFSGDNPYEPVVMRDILDKTRLVRVLKNLKQN